MFNASECPAEDKNQLTIEQGRRDFTESVASLLLVLAHTHSLIMGTVSVLQI